MKRSPREANFELCPDCQGHGTRVLHGAAFTAEDLDEAGPEFVDDMLDGVYDTLCELCQGLRVATPARIKEYRELEAEWRLAQRENGVFW